MKSKYSSSWKSSVQPRKQRKFRANAPNHVRHRLLSAHLDKPLRDEYKRRSARVKKGDEVMIMRGKYKKLKGKVSKVDMKKLKIYIENIKIKKVSGQEVELPFDPSNVKIIKLKLDELRKKSLMKTVVKNDNEKK